MIEDKHPDLAHGAAATPQTDSQSSPSLTPERWEQAKKLFEGALELDPGERASFLHRACADDPVLRREVESLLSSDRCAEGFLEKPALADAGKTESHAIRVGALSVGQVLSGRFRVIRFLGQGGMGEVYEAEDIVLRERIALKTIRPEISSQPHTMARFQQEIKLARRVAHPNVCKTFELWHHRSSTDPSPEVVTFLTMELLEGETLAARLRRVGRIATAEALPLVQQMAEALAAAHDVGVVHRDFKPGNVMLVPPKSGDGKERAVVMDFGLAKALAAADQAAGEDPASSVTGSGHVVGTIAYMSPEQLLGRDATPASDIYALGLVMYEMVTGKRPFPDDALFGGAHQRLTQPPPSPRVHVPDLDPQWEEVILRCLEVEPASRYGNAIGAIGALTVKHEFKAAERVDHPIVAPWFSGKTRARMVIVALAVLLAAVGFFYMLRERGHKIDSVAVLPFSNLSGNSDSEYLVDGITEGIIDSLAKLPNLRVVSRFSVFQYKGRDEDPRAVGKRLGAAALVTGRLRNRGGTIVIEAELVDALKDSQIWGDRYEIGAVEMSAVSEEIASAIADKLRLPLSANDKTRLAESYTNNQTAFKNYLMGRYFWNKRDKDDVQRGIDYFNKAIEVDPGYALAYAGLADSYTVLADYRYEPPQEAFPKARAAAVKALQLNDNLAEAHASLGKVEALYDWDGTAADKEFHRAITLNPSYVPAHSAYAVHLVELGRLDEGLEEARRAHDLDPLDLNVSTEIGTILYYKHDDDGALQQLSKTLEMEPNFLGARFEIAEVYRHQGRYQQAVENYLAAARLNESPETKQQTEQAIATLRKAYEFSGWTAFLQTRLQQQLAASQVTYVAPYEVAEVYAYLGEKDEVLQWLEKAYHERSSEILCINVDPAFQDFRGDARFQDLVRRLGLGKGS